MEVLYPATIVLPSTPKRVHFPAKQQTSSPYPNQETPRPGKICIETDLGFPAEVIRNMAYMKDLIHAGPTVSNDMLGSWAEQLSVAANNYFNQFVCHAGSLCEDSNPKLLQALCAYAELTQNLGHLYSLVRIHAAQGKVDEARAFQRLRVDRSTRRKMAKTEVLRLLQQL